MQDAFTGAANQLGPDFQDALDVLESTVCPEKKGRIPICVADPKLITMTSGDDPPYTYQIAGAVHILVDWCGEISSTAKMEKHMRRSHVSRQRRHDCQVSN